MASTPSCGSRGSQTEVVPTTTPRRGSTPSYSNRRCWDLLLAFLAAWRALAWRKWRNTYHCSRGTYLDPLIAIHITVHHCTPKFGY